LFWQLSPLIPYLRIVWCGSSGVAFGNYKGLGDIRVLTGRYSMHTPSAWTFWLSVALVVLAIVSAFVDIPYVTKYALWVAVVGYIILVIGCRVKTA
jgi:hypothetical protein